jgi:uncharacterized protein involved in type VI secretion and phage assembly
VRVRLPRLGDTPLWAPLSSFYASKAAGAVFYPDVGDEVVVGFVDGELSAPIVLGSVYDATRPPAVSPESGNGTRAIVTRSKLELRFDEEHRIVTIRTPAGHEVTLDDTSGEVRIADATLNKVTLGTGGIRIDSASDLTITAARHVVVSAGGDLRLKATQDVACEGNRVDVEAQTAFSARGNATADLIAAGVVTVRGVVVKIN